MNFVNAYLTHNRPGNKRRRTTAIAIHWVANPGTSAMANRNYFNNTDRSVSSNYIIGLTGEIVRCIPHGEESWCTNQANPYTVSIECCHPDWTGKFNTATYNAAVELCAELCKIYGLNPTNGGLIRHYDVTKKYVRSGLYRRALVELTPMMNSIGRSLRTMLRLKWERRQRHRTLLL